MQMTVEQFDHIRNMREKYFHTGSFEGITGIRPQIMDCWEQYYKDVVIGRKTEKQKVSESELAMACESSRELLNIAAPYMKLLHSFIEQDGFIVSLMDRD
ncbi:MAG: hypothetical protein J5775_03040, partial [Spirochaetales bacterium]|nr:hypothetical protein [Spirochaetales bacterium]